VLRIGNLEVAFEKGYVLADWAFNCEASKRILCKSVTILVQCFHCRDTLA